MLRKCALVAMVVTCLVVLSVPVTLAEDVTLTLSVRFTPSGEEPIFAEITQEIITMFEQENPGIKVEVLWGQREEQLILLTAAGVPPDVFHETIDAVLLPARNGLLMPLDRYFERDKAEFRALLPSVVDVFRLNGKLYALPEYWGATVTAYNQQMFDDMGLPYPKPTWTWESWLQTAKKLTKDKDGDGINDTWVSRGYSDWEIDHMFSNGGFFASADLKEWGGTRKETLESLQFLADAINQHHVIPRPSDQGTVGATYNAWHQGGKLAMEKIGPWDVSVEREANQFKWDVIDNPVSTNTGRAGARSNADGWGIHKDTKHPEEAWKLVKFITSEKVQRLIATAGLGVPARLDVAQRHYIRPETPQDEAVFLRAADFMQFTYHFLWPNTANRTIRQALKRIMDGEVSADVGMQEITPSILAEIQ